MNALLISPQFPDTFWSFKHAIKFLGKSALCPPLGLLTVAALLPRDWGKRLIDLNARPLTAADLQWGNYAFIGGMAVQGATAAKAIARCKQAGLKVVAGGPLFTLAPEQFPQVDHLVLNEAEITLPLFLADLERGCAQRIYASQEPADMRCSPVPLWELADRRRYSMLSIQYSRGCPFNCDFCNVTSLFGRRPRVKSAAQILAELDRMRDLGCGDSIFFVDDNLIGNLPSVKRELLPALIDWQRRRGPIWFNTQVSINLADDEQLMRMMVQAGFDRVFIGIETPDDASLVECRKSQNVRRDLVADVKRIQRAGMEVQGGFIVGFDHDTPAIFQRQIDFIQASGIPTAMVGLLQAPWGTRLHERLEREGRLVGETSGDNVDGTTNIIPRMDGQILREGYRRLMRHLYSPQHYYQRLKAFLKEFNPKPDDEGPQREDLCALARSMMRLGVLSEERWHYWKLLAWTLWHRPELLDEVVFLLVFGYHCRKVCELHLKDE